MARRPERAKASRKDPKRLVYGETTTPLVDNDTSLLLEYICSMIYHWNSPHCFVHYLHRMD